MAATMTRRERLQAAIAGEAVDRPPIALWRHFPVDDQDPSALADSVLAFQHDYDFDFIKVTAASSYSVRDWGVEDAWQGETEGTRTYTRRVIGSARDWEQLRRLNPQRGALADQLSCLRQVLLSVQAEVPVIPTIFAPLSQAKHLAGETRMLEHLRRDPQALRRGLETITRSTIAFIEVARSLGISGIFYAIQHASYRLFDRETYRRVTEDLDRQILEAAGGLWLNVLHLHGEALMFDLAGELPVQVVNWHDRHTAPTLVEGKRLVAGAVCGGLSREETLVLGTPVSVWAEARQAIRSLRGRGMVLGAGCVVPITAPRANLQAARRAVDFA